MSSAATGTNVWSTQPRLFRIGDVANVTDTYETQRVYAYSDGIPCVELDIQKSAGTSEVETSKHVLAALPGLRRTYPDVQFTILNVQSTYTEQQLTGVMRTLIEAIDLHRHRDAVLPALVAQRDRRDDRDPGLAAGHAGRDAAGRTSPSTPSRCSR